MESRLGLLAKHKKEWKWMGVNYLVGLVEKGVLKNLNSSGVSIYLLSCEMEYKTEISKLVSEFVPDDILIVGKSGGGKAKSGIIGIGVWNWLGGNLSGVGIQVVGSSWAKKMIILRLKSGDMGLFYNLFIRIIIL